MPWQVRHQGSPRIVRDLTLPQIVQGLRDGVWETTDEVLGPGDTRWQPIETHPQLAEIAEDLEPPRTGRHPDATSLDMNALIDVCLVLLIFFILTTSYANLVQKVVPIPAIRSDGKVRTVKAADVKDRMVVMEATGDPAGKLAVRLDLQPVDVLDAGGKLDAAKLRSKVESFVGRGSARKRELMLDARGITWETVIQIQDAARAAGIQKIHYATEKKPAAP